MGNFQERYLLDLDILRKIMKEENEFSEKDLILLKTEILKNVKCGVCNNDLYIDIYSLHGKMVRRIYCKKCKSEVWK